MSNEKKRPSPGPDRFDLEGIEVPEALVNDVIRLMASHRSIRSYRSDPLPERLVEVLATAAQSASTSSNLQTYSIIAVRDVESKRLLAEWSSNPFAADAPAVTRPRTWQGARR